MEKITLYKAAVRKATDMERFSIGRPPYIPCPLEMTLEIDEFYSYERDLKSFAIYKEGVKAAGRNSLIEAKKHMQTMIEDLKLDGWSDSWVDAFDLSALDADLNCIMNGHGAPYGKAIAEGVAA